LPNEPPANALDGFSVLDDGKRIIGGIPTNQMGSIVEAAD